MPESDEKVTVYSLKGIIEETRRLIVGWPNEKNNPFRGCQFPEEQVKKNIKKVVETMDKLEPKEQEEIKTTLLKLKTIAETHRDLVRRGVFKRD